MAAGLGQGWPQAVVADPLVGITDHPIAGQVEGTGGQRQGHAAQNGDHGRQHPAMDLDNGRVRRVIHGKGHGCEGALERSRAVAG
jgi:hypothetical protein